MVRAVPRVGLAEVLRRHGSAYLAAHPLSFAKAKVWRAILACRTPALGGHVDVCDTCGTTRRVYFSCRNRHCPQCQTRAKEAWLAARRREVLPVPYFHLVFTLPHDLNGLIGQCPRVLYEMLFGAVSATLTEFAANPRWLGGTPAFSLVLHTWKQDLARHVHAHALMAGGALGIDGRWVAAKRGFLFPVKALSKVYRGKFVAALKAARQGGKLQEAEFTEHTWRDLLARVHQHDWVVYAKEPLGGPQQVLDYLGRYTHRVAISNERILDIGADTVSVRVRDSAHGNRRRTLSVPAQTFIERFLLHVLPKGFKRIRHYGLIGPAHKAARLASARAALDAPAPDPLVVESVEAFMRRIDQHQRMRCPHCGKGQFVTTATIAAVPLPLLHLRGPP
jgi:Putative transposase/Transposase zinc-binding domain